MTDMVARLLLLLAALVLPAAALVRRRPSGRSTGQLMLLWAAIIGLVWLVASIGPKLVTNFT